MWSFKSYLIQRTELSVRCFELVIQRFMHMQMTYGAVFYRDKCVEIDALIPTAIWIMGLTFETSLVVDQW